MVDMITKSVQVPKEVDEVMVAIVNILKVTKQALADGWQPGQDLPVILTAAATNLLPAVDGMNKIGDEWKQERAGVLRSTMLGSADIVDAMLPVQEPAPVA